MSEGQRGVGTRLYVSGGKEVRREFDQVADSGKRMWNEIASGQRSANPALQGLSRGVSKVKDEAREVGDEAEDAARKLGLWGAAGIATGAALTAMATTTALAMDAFAFADEIKDSADNIGVGVEALQAWRYAVKASGGDMMDADRALESFQRKLGAAQSGSSKAALEAFQRLGFTQEQLQSYDSAEAALLDVTEKVAGLSKEAQRASIMKDLGISELASVARGGADGVSALLTEARNLGWVLDEHVIEKGAAANEQLETMAAIINLRLKASFIELAPEIVGATEKLVGFVDWLAEATKDRRFKITMETAGGFPEAFMKGGFIGASNYLGDQARKASRQAFADKYDRENPWFFGKDYTDPDDPMLAREAGRRGEYAVQHGNVLSPPPGRGSRARAKAKDRKITIEVEPIEMVTGWDMATGERLKAATPDDVAFWQMTGVDREEYKRGVSGISAPSSSGFESSRDRMLGLTEQFNLERDAFRSSFEDTLRGGLEAAFYDGWPGVLSYIADSLKYALIDSLTESISAALFDRGGSSGGGLWSSIFGLGASLLGGGAGAGAGAEVGTAAHFAGSWGRNAAGGMLSVGDVSSVAEYGPELAIFGRPGQMFPADDTRRLLQSAAGGSGGGDVHVSIGATVINAQGAGPREIDQLRAQMADMERSLPGTIVETVVAARDRGVLPRPGRGG